MRASKITAHEICGSGLLICLVLLISFYALNYFGRMIPPGHDMLGHMMMQFAQSNGVASGEWVAKWIPTVGFGTTGSFTYTGGVSIVLNTVNTIIYFFSPLAENTYSFVPIYYMHLLFTELGLVLGVWLLSQLLFTSTEARFFVTVSASLSTIAVEQHFFALALIAPIPLVLYAFQLFIEKNDARHIAPACLFAIYSSLNLAFYICIIQLLIYTLYIGTVAAMHWLGNRGRIRLSVKGMRLAIWAMLLVVCTLANVYPAVHDWNVIDRSSVARNTDGTSSLKVFNTHGNHLGLAKYTDTIRGMNSGSTDLPVFRGFLVIALLPFSLLALPRRGVPVLLVATVLFLFSFGAVLGVSTALWHVFPLMRYYRHVAFVAPAATFFFCFVAGFGFDALTNNQHIDRFYKYALPALGVCFVATLIACCTTRFQPGFITPQKAVVSLGIISTYMLCLIAAWDNKTAYIPRLLCIFLMLNVFDIYTYRADIALNRFYPATATELSLWDFHALKFQPQRSGTYLDTERGAIFSNQLPRNTLYATISMLLDYEPATGNQRTDIRQRCVNEFLQRYPLEGDSVARDISGITAPKVQFYSQAVFDQARDGQAPEPYHSGRLYVEGGASGLPPLAVQQDTTFGDTDARLNLSYAVQRFNANTLVLSLGAPTSAPLWVYYSDAWNPRWTTLADGVGIKTYKAYSTFKAALLPAGTKEVTFKYVDTLLDGAVLVNRLACLYVMGWVLLLCASGLTPGIRLWASYLGFRSPSAD